MLMLENVLGYLGQTEVEIRQQLDAVKATFDQAKSMMRGEVEGATLRDVMPLLVEAAQGLKTVEGSLEAANFKRADQPIYHEFSEMRDAVLNQAHVVDSEAVYYPELKGESDVRMKEGKDTIYTLLDNPKARIVETLDRAMYFKTTGAEPRIGYIDYNPQLPDLPEGEPLWKLGERDKKSHINPSRPINEEIARITAFAVEDPRIEVFAQYARTWNETQSLLKFLKEARWYQHHHERAFPKEAGYDEYTLMKVKGVASKPLAPAAIRKATPVPSKPIVIPKAKAPARALRGLDQVSDPFSWPETSAFVEAASKAGARAPEAMQAILSITGTIGNTLPDSSISDGDKKALLVAATGVLDGIGTNTWAWVAASALGLVVVGGIVYYFLKKR